MRKRHLRGRGPHMSPLDRIVQFDFEPGYVVFTEPVAKRVRVKVGDITIADSIDMILLFETEHQQRYCFPIKDIRMDLMRENEHVTSCRFKGTAHHYTVNAGGKVVENIMWRYAEPLPQCPPIADYAGFYWDKVDHWYEEDEEIFVHARDPFRRVDCLPSSRLVQVYVNGALVAESRGCVFLFETGLPTRYYMPRDDIRGDILRPSNFATGCPYKGQAGYYHVEVSGKLYENLVWYYAEPKREVWPIAGRLCFANEFVDRILVDGIEQKRPQTGHSHGYE